MIAIEIINTFVQTKTRDGMELRQLKYFATVAQTLNFTDASRMLFITQGTLSQQIKQLEDEIGTPLFIRTSHSVMLTDAGEELLPFAQKTIAEAANCKNKMNDLKKILTGSLNIGVTHSFSTLLVGTIKEFLKKYPNVKLNINYATASELFEMLHERKLDFILAFKPLQEYEAIQSEVLFRSSLSIVMRKEHPMATHKSITMEELQKLSIALPGSGLQARRAFERFIDIDTSKLNIKIELNDPNMIMNIVQGTNLVSILSSIAIIYHPNLTAIPLEGVRREMIGCYHFMKDIYHKRAGEVFLQMLRESPLISQLN